MKLMVIPNEIGSLGTITKGLVKGLEDMEIGGQMETFQTTALLRSVRVLRRVLETVTQIPVEDDQLTLE